MTQTQQNELETKFDSAMAEMMEVSRQRNFCKDDFKKLNWIVRNLDRVRNYTPDELDYDAQKEEVIVRKSRGKVKE